MPTLVRKRRAGHDQPTNGRASDSDGDNARQRRQQRQRRSSTEETMPAQGGPADAGEDSFMGDGGDTQTDGASKDQMVKKMVRLALASEYSRQPIRRADIGTRVLGQYGRQFKPVFEAAQKELRDKFGMEMTELPLREKVTISQRRAAQKTEKAATSSKQWILTSILPEKYRVDDSILCPPKVPTTEAESTYIGLYSFIISVISLCGGTISEAKLDRYLKRADADEHTPVDKTDKLLQRLCKEGYLVKLKDSSGGEEVVEYMVGPRGKVEIGTDGVAGLVKTVYGDDAVDDLDSRVQRSLGLSDEKRKREPAADGQREAVNGTGQAAGRRRKTRQNATAVDDDDDSDDSDED